MDEKNIEQIKNRIKDIEIEMDSIRMEMRQLFDKARENGGPLDHEKINLLRNEDDKLYYEKANLETELFFLLPPINSNGIIDLRLRLSDESSSSYVICLHNTQKIIGNIQYRSYHVNTIGDIGYAIEEDFRGNNYAYQALVLLSEKLNEDGIEDFWIAVHEGNIPSLKTIQKYGGKLIDKQFGRLLFECETKRKELENNDVSKTR